MFDLTGRGALVTGASGGIGEAVARRLHAQGATVAVSGTRAEKLEALKEALGGERVHVTPCNLSDRTAVAELPKTAEAALGSLDILVNNAGVMTTPNWKTTDGFDMQFGTNHLGHFLLTELLMPLIKKSTEVGNKPR